MTITRVTNQKPKVYEHYQSYKAQTKGVSMNVTRITRQKPKVWVLVDPRRTAMVYDDDDDDHDDENDYYDGDGGCNVGVVTVDQWRWYWCR